MDQPTNIAVKKTAIKMLSFAKMMIVNAKPIIKTVISFQKPNLSIKKSTTKSSITQMKNTRRLRKIQTKLLIKCLKCWTKLHFNWKLLVWTRMKWSWKIQLLIILVKIIWQKTSQNWMDRICINLEQDKSKKIHNGFNIRYKSIKT